MIASGRAAPGFATTYDRLPPVFHRAAEPTPVTKPTWIARNDALAAELGMAQDWLRSDAVLAQLSGNAPLPGASPLALGYSGHQFGQWVPVLGDGRAHLIGEWVTPAGRRYDLQLKGSGPTPFSRNGDGRATLGAMLREYIVSTAMSGLGIPTTRSLAVIATGEPVYRRIPEPGAVLTRIAASHVRVGTFQYAASRQDRDALRALADYKIARNFAGQPQDGARYRWFLKEVIARQASLIARWMSVGFIHGVMNTDNMSVAGETIDYGPCAFMDAFHPQKVFSSIDQFGRYAWDKQPTIALWNLTRFAESLLALLHDQQDEAIEIAKSELEKFMPAFEAHFEHAMRWKLGLLQPHPEDGQFIAATFRHMMEGEADFTLFFRRLTQIAQGHDNHALAQLFNDRAIALSWLAIWRNRLAIEQQSHEARIAAMKAANPIFIARNHRVEEAIAEANAGTLIAFNRLVGVLAHPFDEQSEDAELETAPNAGEVVTATFCGT